MERITSYARSHTIARISDENLKAMNDAGLNRIHIGLESGADRVLERIAKGAAKELHIKAGIKVKAAGMELSEYVMPGLGGKDLSTIHAAETADALNRINPHFIRLEDMEVPHLRQETENACRELGATPENVDVLIDSMMRRFV